MTLLSLLCAAAYAGTEPAEKGMKQVVPPPCPEWYSDNEINLSVWGTYAFTNTEYARNLWLVDVVQTRPKAVPFSANTIATSATIMRGAVVGTSNIFLHRYFGVGIEGFILDANKGGFDIFEDPGVVFFRERTNNSRAVGSVLGTFTLRYPIACTRFSPYAWAGIGAIFGGGEHDQLVTSGVGQVPDAFDVVARTRHFDSKTEMLGQFGVGLEFRMTRHIGWTNDLSWGVIDGPRNNFGMIRSGLNFAF